jgi:hypothetical protein
LAAEMQVSIRIGDNNASLILNYYYFSLF